MRKFFVALVATFLIMFGGVSLAAPGGQSDDKRPEQPADRGPEKGDKGAACPDSSPNPERTPPPGCGFTDSDGDGIPDQGDNCPDTKNEDQADTDGDGVGDACDDNGDPDPDPDPDPDADGDGVPDAEDNCPDTPAGEADADGDGCGDETQDNCTGLANDQADADGDGVGDACDGCADSAEDQIDADGDGCEDDDGGIQTQGCTENGGDAGFAGDTIAQQAYDGGLSALPIVVDPEGDGPISGEIKAGGKGTPLEPLTNEVACVVSLPAAGL